eukprot:354746-Chlamydomonas_euryale.AAC.1
MHLLALLNLRILASACSPESSSRAARGSFAAFGTRHTLSVCPCPCLLLRRKEPQRLKSLEAQKSAAHSPSTAANATH